MRKTALFLNYTVDLGIAGERECAFTVNYYPGHPGSWYKRNGDPGDPPEPDDFEVIGAVCDGINIADLVSDYLQESDNFREAVAEAYEIATYPEEV